jgi:two-component system sensor histidine kinase BaeS
MASGTSVRIDMADRGPGILPSDLPHVFEKFYRGSGARQQGSGLGLAVARHIVEQHGGSITIQSIVGQGTTVSIILPASIGATSTEPKTA